ncbi:MAG: DUF4097 domain-containing protein [Ruminococcaceae bacterium]|nr:DUF4097 domain-containing protein [Oscillospiraceae bacterium]
MRKKLIKHIDKLCKKSMNTTSGRELHDEMLQNTLERYDEELASGKGEKEAFDIALSGLGNMDEVMKPTGKKRSVKKTLLCAVATICLIALVVTGCAFTSVEYYDDPSSYSVGSGSVSGEVKSLDISWTSGKLIVKAYDGDQIVLTETGATTENQKMRYRLQNGVLTVHYQASGVNISTPFSKTLEIQIPRAQAEVLKNGEIELAGADAEMNGLGVEALEIETASGNVVASNCAFAFLEADTASGDCTFTSCAIASMEMSAASGNTKIDGTLDSLEFDAASGNLTLQSAQAPSSLEAETASGDITITIPADSQFRCEYETASGDVEINGFTGNYRDDEFICGSGENVYSFDVASGDITINAA